VDSIKKISVCQLNKIDKPIEFVKYRKGEFAAHRKGDLNHTHASYWGI